MNEVNTEVIAVGYADGSDQRMDEFHRWLEAHDRDVAAKAWQKAWIEVRSLPHWYNPATGEGGFDLQPNGLEPATEEGAFMAVFEVLNQNPYKNGEKL